MKYRILGLLLSFCLCTFSAFSQRMFNDCIQNPKVEKQYVSKIGKMKIESVCLVNGYTIVEFSLISNRDVQQGVVSLSSTTMMTYKYQGKKIKAAVREWGSVDMFDYRRLKFDERYHVRAGQSYRFYMAFDPMPYDVQKISIKEDGHKGFYWEDIHINDNGGKKNSPDTDEGKKKEDGKKKDKKKDRKQEYTPRRNNDSNSDGGVWI